MKDLKQIALITNALRAEKDKHLFDLGRTNGLIEKKKYLIDTMKKYLCDYTDASNFKLSNQTPMLIKNLTNFCEKIRVVIKQTEYELQQLTNSAGIIIKRIEKADQKIKLMNKFEEKIVQSNLLKIEKHEQNQLDDLSINRHIRGQHE